jgi:hypothetical protein
LNQAKSLFKGRYGEAVDEDVVDEAGVRFIVTRGGDSKAPPSMDALEQRLSEVKGLYMTTCSEPEADMEELESSLKAVKLLYQEKYGEDVDDTDSEDEDGEECIEATGTANAGKKTETVGFISEPEVIEFKKSHPDAAGIGDGTASNALTAAPSEGGDSIGFSTASMMTYRSQ